MHLLHLDINGFQRSFDDFTQLLIQMEALACQEIFLRAENKELQLIWSFIHQDEADLCSSPTRKSEIFRLANLCQVRVAPHEIISNQALAFQVFEPGLSAKDALHLATACFAKADYLITCDKRFIRQARRLNVELTILNPVEYLQKDA